MLQRVGLGLCLSLLNMVVAALVEAKRVTISAKEYDLMDKLEAIVPTSVWWLLPQYILCVAWPMCSHVLGPNNCSLIKCQSP